MEAKKIKSSNFVEDKNETIGVNEIADEVLNGTHSKHRLGVKRFKHKNEDRKVTSRNANSLFLLLRNSAMIEFVLFSLLCSVSASREQRFAIEPQDQSAVVGSRVTLPCRVVNKVGQLQWTKDDFGLGTHRHLVGYDRYKMIGSDEEGDYSLDILDVTLDDDASYQCQVSTGPRGEPAIRSSYARLVVLVPPDPPKILQGSVLQAVEDREVTLVCVSVGGKPAAEITWVDNDGGVLTQGVNYTVEEMSDRRRFTAKSVLQLRPRKHHHNQTFTCQAQNTADRAYRSTTIQLQVQYAPKVRVFLKTGITKGRIQEGDTLIIGCQAHGNPNVLNFKWYINKEQIISDTSNEMVITNISRNFNEASIKCEVHNAVGKSSDTKTIEVSYGPSFKLRPHNAEGESGSSVSLHCAVDGHPSPKITWLRSEDDRIIKLGKTDNLTITVSQYTAGRYWCRASVDGYRDIEASAMVYVKGTPRIMSNQTQFGVEGDSVRVECMSFSVPKPDFVLWTFKGIEINAYHNQEYAFLEESLADGMTKSTLIIRESNSKHFGTYNCSVTNLYGTDSMEIQLIPDKTFPLIMVVSGSTSAVIILLIGMLIIMICHRKTNRMDLVKKPDITDIGKNCVDQFKDCDRSSNISDLKMELRQIEGSCEVDNPNMSETEFQSNLHLTSNIGLPLAGPVSLPDGSSYDNELMKQYQRYSADFNQPITKLNIKSNGQSNGYVPYVDYSRDYTPSDSFTGSLSRHLDNGLCGSLNRQTSCGRLTGLVGPDLIPMTSTGVVLTNGVDVRYAATYGNPYLRSSGPNSYTQNLNSSNSGLTPAPPPYYSVRNSNLPLPVASGTSPSSTSSSRPVTSSMASSSSATSSAQPQVPKMSPGYILPPITHFNLSNQITVKGNPQTAGTHV